MLKNQLPHSNITEEILNSCFEVINELGSGFLENVYKNSLFITMKQKNLDVEIEKVFEVGFRGYKVGKYVADLIVENNVIIELKCCKCLLPEHQAQLINYLKVSGIEIGILVNFGNPKLEYKRLYNPDIFKKFDIMDGLTG